MSGGDGIGQLVEAGKVMVGDDEFHRASLEVRTGFGGKGEAPSDHESSADPAVCDCRRQGSDVIGSLGGSGVGEAGDTVGEQFCSCATEVRWLQRDPVFEPGVETVQSAGGDARRVPVDSGLDGVIEADGVNGGAVEDPHGAASMLDADGPVWHDPVEVVAIEIVGDGLVVADAPQPATGSGRVARCPQRRGEVGRMLDIGRTDGDGMARRGERHEVDVVVVEAGDEGAAGGVENVVAGGAGQGGGHGGDLLAGDADVDEPSVELGPTGEEVPHNRVRISAGLVLRAATTSACPLDMGLDTSTGRVGPSPCAGVGDHRVEPFVPVAIEMTMSQSPHR